MADSAGNGNPGDAEESLGNGGSGGGGVAATPAANARYAWGRRIKVLKICKNLKYLFPFRLVFYVRFSPDARLGNVRYFY